MELNLQRPLLFFDIESTGLDIPTESIIELCFVKVFPGNPEPKVKTWRIKPWDYEKNIQRPVSPEASAINGITDDELTGCPRFIDVAPEIVEWLRGSDLAGFNAAKFDLPLLVEEIERVKDYFRRRKDNPKAQEMLSTIEIDLHEPVMVDVQNIYHAMEPRNLKAAYRFYCGKELDNAHSAEADTLATYEVLKGQLDMYRGLKNDISSMGVFAGKKYVDFSGRLIYDNSGLKDPSHILINFGKHKDKSAREVYETDRSYFDWVENGSFTLDTKAQFARIRKEIEAEKRGPASPEALNELKEKWSSGTLF